MALVHRERDETPGDGGRHRAVVPDTVQRRVPGTHMHPGLKKGAAEKP